MSDEAPEISVVIPTYNRKELLERCLRSLLAQTIPPDDYEIIVVDDGGRVGAGQMVQKLAGSSPVPILYCHQQNQGPAAARNRGVQLARGRIVAFIDDDCSASPEWLARITEPLKDDAVGGVGGLNLSRSQRGAINSYCSFKELHEKPKIVSGEVVHLLTANSAFRRSALIEVGVFKGEIASPFKGVAPGAEDTDLSIRLRQKGYRLAYNPDALTYHHHDKTASGLFKEMFNFGYNHALFIHPLDKKDQSLAGFLRSIAWVCLSFARLPWHYVGCRRRGLSRRCSLLFPLIEKTCMLANKSGGAVALLKRTLKKGF